MALRIGTGSRRVIGAARASGRVCLLAILALTLGAGAALRSVHLGSADHGHRYCPQHDQIEAVAHGHGHGHAADRGPEEAGVRVGQTASPDPHVACALLNALAARAPFAPEPSNVSAPAAAAVQGAVELAAPLARLDRILSFAPKTSPPFVTA